MVDKEKQIIKCIKNELEKHIEKQKDYFDIDIATLKNRKKHFYTPMISWKVECYLINRPCTHERNYPMNK